MTPQQKQIIRDAQERGGRITKREINAMYADNYYCNGKKHLGEILSRMVKSGLLIREKKGVFVIGKGTKQKPATIIENQQALF